MHLALNSNNIMFFVKSNEPTFSKKIAFDFFKGPTQKRRVFYSF